MSHPNDGEQSAASPPVAEPVKIPAAAGAPPFVLPGPIALGAQVAMQVWQSPYPPPEAVERYEAVSPGAFDRILTMVEKGQQAQIDALVQANTNLYASSRLGMWLGFMVAVGSVVGAVVCAYFNQPLVAVALVGVPVFGLAKALASAGATTQTPPTTKKGQPEPR